MTEFDPAMVEAMASEIGSDEDWFDAAVRVLRALPISAAALNALWKGEAVVVSVKHYHIDNRKDTRCASCGHDPQHSIHLRVGEEVPDLRSASPYAKEAKDG